MNGLSPETAPITFCSLADIHYAPKALALYRSLERHCPNFIMYFLPLDTLTAGLFADLNLPRMKLWSMRSIHAHSRILRMAMDRPHSYFCFTMASVLSTNLLKCSVSDSVTYLDADTLVFSDPAPVFGEIWESKASIAAVAHNFPDNYAHYIDRGQFNVSAVYFRNDEMGRACASRWSDACLQQCDESTVGDQLHLNSWPEMYGNSFHEIAYRGFGAGPWHAGDDTFGPGPTFNSQKLIMYHFHELRKAVVSDTSRLLQYGGESWRITDYPVSPSALEYVYTPYLESLCSSYRESAP